MKNKFKFKKLVLIFLTSLLLVGCNEKESIVKLEDDEIKVESLDERGEEVFLKLEKGIQNSLVLNQEVLKTIFRLEAENKVYQTIRPKEKFKDENLIKLESVNIVDKLEDIEFENIDFIIGSLDDFRLYKLDIKNLNDRGIKTYILLSSLESDILKRNLKDIENIGRIYSKSLEARKIVDDIEDKIEKLNKDGINLEIKSSELISINERINKIIFEF